MQADVISQKFGGTQYGQNQNIMTPPNDDTQISSNEPIPVDVNARPQTAGNATMAGTVNQSKKSK